MSHRHRSRPRLRVELGDLGAVDPFGLRLEENPPGSADYFVTTPEGARMPLERAGLGLVGAGQALLALSLRWMSRAGRDPGSGLGCDADPDPLGEVRLLVKRKEARLLAALLRRHVQRLPEPPEWMPRLLVTLEQIDEFLRWEE